MYGFLKSALIISTMVTFSIFTVGGSISFPRVQMLEFDAVVIKVTTRKLKCDKYHKLFMELLHESLDCSEDSAGKPSESERCLKLSKLLSEYSRLRSKYCYGEDGEAPL